MEVEVKVGIADYEKELSELLNFLKKEKKSVCLPYQSKQD